MLYCHTKKIELKKETSYEQNQRKKKNVIDG